MQIMLKNINEADVKKWVSHRSKRNKIHRVRYRANAKALKDGKWSKRHISTFMEKTNK